MTVQETRQAFPYDAYVYPESNSRLTYASYLARHGISPKQFRGTVGEGSSGSNITVVDGTISWSGGDWVNGEPKAGKSAAEYMERGGRWFVLHDEVHNGSPMQYFAAYPEQLENFTGVWRFSEFPFLRVDLWSFEMTIRFANGRVIETSRVEVPD